MLFNIEMLFFPALFGWFISCKKDIGTKNWKNIIFKYVYCFILVNTIAIYIASLRGVYGLNFSGMTVSFKIKYSVVGIFAGITISVISEKVKFILIKKPYASIAVLWAMVSLAFGRLFLKSHLEEALENHYVYALDTYLQKLVFIIAYIIALTCIYFVCRFVYLALTIDGRERKVLLCALPLLLVLGSYLIADVVDSGRGVDLYYVGDEKNIWDAAVAKYPFFFIYSSELFLVCFCLVPVVLAPSIVKICFVASVFGYIVYRINECYKSYWGCLLYVVFCMQPVLSYGIRVHRMHWYAVLYLFVMVKLFFDKKTECSNKRISIIIVSMSILLSVLTIWRREGIYFLISGGVLLWITYGETFQKSFKRLLLLFLTTEMCICLPILVNEKTNKIADGNISFQAIIVHMLAEESFDRTKFVEEMEDIDKVLNIGIVDKYNTECKSEAYNECYWAAAYYKDKQYYAVRNYTNDELEEFKKAVISIIMKDPIVFIKSRISAFNAIASKKTNYNLYLPVFLSILILIYGFLKKEVNLVVMFMGILCHSVITVLLMPASYFKYFYAMYLCAYVFLIIIFIEYIYNENKKV